MVKVVITEQAQRDIDELVDNIIEFTYSVISGIKLFEDLHEKIELIAFMPLGIGRLRDDGTRETFCRGYRIIYEIVNNEVHIRTVVHSRRLYPTGELR
ncbi:type II toxin-antitoxin system RelE/ParE family toxin [Pasteurella testudinis]|uniref:type II toxin-antitoxin system RelE/ParE family toxin n=1 Tax=Pasteurella testudinis TaxID=761 RepID=UPI0040584F8B